MRTRLLLPLLALLLVTSDALAQRWDARGWVLLGETHVRGNRGRHERIELGREAGRFTRVAVVVENGEADLADFVVYFRHGEPFRPDLRYRFREGSRSAPIDLPGEARSIQAIEFDARDTPRRGRAVVQVWGEQAARDRDRDGDRDRDRDRGGPPLPQPPPVPPPPPPRQGFIDRSGWVALGEASVDGRVDRDTIPVGVRDGRFRRIMLVVEEGEIELFGMTVVFGRGETFSPEVRHFFREGARSRVIDLPGDARFIRQVDFAYGNLRRGARARVQLLAQ